MMEVPGIAPVTGDIDLAAYRRHFADCLVLTQGGRLLLQYRPLNWHASPGWLTAFGGHVEPGETVMEALRRELKEELGAAPAAADVVFIGAVTEAETAHRDMVHIHFWHDAAGSITGCYEAEAREYDSAEAALKTPKVMDYLRWALLRAREMGLLAG